MKSKKKIKYKNNLKNLIKQLNEKNYYKNPKENSATPKPIKWIC